ncbi:MAG: PLP-dependent aminotransferase family protein [Clostridiales bacterium]|nr:PLP-dependent aminotransferase family protein [Clostridiales bacterium]
MEILLDKNLKMPIYIQIAEQIKTQIITKELLPGMSLPPERKLATQLGVNRSTVLNAYNSLKQEGYIEAQVGRGTIVVSTEESGPDINEVKEPCWSQLFNLQVKEFDNLLMRDTLPLINPDHVISFGLGIANPDEEPLLPFEELAKEVATNPRCKALTLTPIGGYQSLRTILAASVRKKSIPCVAEQVMVVTGSQQGIDLATRILIEPGDIVVVEAPTYFLGLQSFRAAGARIMEVPTDRNGMRIDQLELLLKRYHPKMIYTMPNYQNPSSVCMSLDRRKRLVELAQKHDIMIIEDDVYGEFHYENEELPALAALDRSGHVIYLKTFSKCISPGLRLGYMVAHKKIIETCSLVRQGEDVHPNSISQWLVEYFLSHTDMDSYLADVCERNRKKRDLMNEEILKYAPSGMTFVKPKGGIYIWCRLPDNVNASKLLEATLKRNVAFMPGNTFFLSEEGEHYIRLNFSYPKAAQIREGIRVICEETRYLSQSKKSEEIHNSELVPLY